MRLKQGDSAHELVWIGGEPIENEGDQGTRSLPLWNNGEFSVEQRMPDFRGQLTSGIEMRGSLRPGQTQALYKLCADNVLSADVDLLRGNGEAAQVRFTLGKAETASINGQSEPALSALSKLSGWVDGTFRVTLRALFTENAAEAPVFKDKSADSDDKFDVTGSVNIDINKGPVQWPAELREAAGLPGLPGVEGSGKRGPEKPAAVAQPQAPASARSGPTPASVSPVPPRLAATVLTPPKPAASTASPGAAPPVNSTAATVPMTTVPRPTPAMKSVTKPLTKPATKSGGGLGRTLVIVSVLIIVLCAGVVATLFLLKR
jgi:hypothetical protein